METRLENDRSKGVRSPTRFVAIIIGIGFILMIQMKFSYNPIFEQSRSSRSDFVALVSSNTTSSTSENMSSTSEEVFFPKEVIDQGPVTKEEHEAEEHPETLSLSLTTYSYNTTDVDEFKRLHREYLINQQQKLTGKDSYLSTKARGRRKDGKPITTFSFGPGRFFSGFRNQIMALVMLCIRANLGEHEQLLLGSLNHKDTYGTAMYEPFEFFFDVEHWNRYSYNEEDIERTNVSLPGLKNPNQYPNWLPRLVYCNQSLHDQWDTGNNRHKSMRENATRPFAFGDQASSLMLNYMRYVRGRGPFPPQFIDRAEQRILRRNPAEIIMLQGALKPHPALQAVVDRSKEYLLKQGQRRGDLTSTSLTTTTATATTSSFRYMTLHARVEPDMQKHPVCRDKKVIELQDIVDMIESKWSETPPVDVVFLPINRQKLEEEGTLPENYKNDTETNEQINWVAVRNLQLLNRLTNHKDANDGKSIGGLWNGSVPVIEFGSEALRGTVYEHRPSISGAILNFFLGLDAHIFIGTEVSSFSHDVLNTRFFRGQRYSENYKYLPGGLTEWITDDMTAPPGFLC